MKERIQESRQFPITYADLLRFQRSYDSLLLDDPPGSFLVIDIETEGLSRQGHPVFLLGCLEISANRPPLLHQWIWDRAEDAEEEAILSCWQHFLAAHPSSCLVSFNGSSFDLPFLAARGQRYHFGFPPLSHLDLYPLVRRYRPFFSKESMKLQLLEKKSGFQREDRLTGKDMIPLAKNPTEENQALALLHNRDDLFATAWLVPYLTDAFSIFLFSLPLPEKQGSLCLEKLQKQGDFLQITLQSSRDLPSLFLRSSFADLAGEEGYWTLRLPVHRARLHDHALLIAVSPGYDHDQSPYELRSPFLVLEDEGHFLKENILPLLQSLLLHLLSSIPKKGQ